MAETISSLQDLKSATAEVVEAPVHVQKIDKLGRAYATGKRKNAVARVWIKPGSGKVSVNGRELEVYFARPVLRMILQQPLGVANRNDSYDITVTVAGGGLSGQAGAVRHGLSKALTYYEPALRGALKKAGFLTRELARGGTQEIRQAQGSPQLPVLEALIPFHGFRTFSAAGLRVRRFFVWALKCRFRAPSTQSDRTSSARRWRRQVHR